MDNELNSSYVERQNSARFLLRERRIVDKFELERFEN